VLLKVAIGLCHEASWRADIGEAAHVEALLATVEGLLWVRGPGGRIAASKLLPAGSCCLI